MKKAEMKKYEARNLEIGAFSHVCGRIDYLMEDCQRDMDRYGHTGEFDNGEEPSDWEMDQVAECQVRMQAYEVALAAVMKLMGA